MVGCSFGPRCRGEVTAFRARVSCKLKYLALGTVEFEELEHVAMPGYLEPHA